MITGSVNPGQSGDPAREREDRNLCIWLQITATGAVLREDHRPPNNPCKDLSPSEENETVHTQKECFTTDLVMGKTFLNGGHSPVTVDLIPAKQYLSSTDIYKSRN